MLGLACHKDWATLQVLRRARRERRSMVTNRELFIIHSIASGMVQVPGEYAEVGIYQGSTAKVICEAKGDKRLHLCDTFAGLPEPVRASSTWKRKAVYGAAWSRSRRTCERFQI